MNRLFRSLLIGAAFALPTHSALHADEPGDTTTVYFYNEVPVTDNLVLEHDLTELSIASGSTVMSGDISETGGLRSIVKIGAGTLTLSGEGTYTGSTTVAEGTLALNDYSVIPGLSALTINSGATLALLDYIAIDAGSLSGSGTLSLGSSAWLTIGDDDTSTTFSGTIQSTSDGGSLTKTGTGKLTFTGNAVIDGILEMCGCFIESNNALEISGGSFVASQGTSVFGGHLSVSNGGTLSTDFLYVDGEMVITSTASVQATEVRVGNVVEGSASLEVSHGGVLNADTLTISINSVLSGDGTINAATTIEEGSRLAPGNSPDTLVFTEGLTLENGSILDIELGSSSDLIRISGGAFEGEAGGEIVLNLSNAGGFAAGTYTFIDFTGATLDLLDTDSFVFGTLIDGYTFTIAMDGSEFVLIAQAIPEPSTAIILGGALLLGGVFRRKLLQR